eukprot:12930448-Prorocentrum_lima.AAC.1
MKKSQTIYPVFIAPDPDNVVYFAEVFGVDQDWTFADLPADLQDQLIRSMPASTSVEAPASSSGVQDVFGQQEAAPSKH